MYKNLWKTSQFSLVPEHILTPHLRTVVKQLSYLKYFMGQWLKKKYHLQEVSKGMEYGTRNIYYCLKFVTLVLKIYFEQNSVYKLENTPCSRPCKDIHSFFFVLLQILHTNFRMQTAYNCS